MTKTSQPSIPQPWSATDAHVRTLFRATARDLRERLDFRVALRLRVDATAFAGLCFSANTPPKAERYAAQMARGEFRLAASPICLIGGRVADGNHRVTSVVVHGQTIPRAMFLWLPALRRDLRHARTALFGLVCGVIAHERVALESIETDLDLTTHALDLMADGDAALRLFDLAYSMPSGPIAWCGWSRCSA